MISLTVAFSFIPAFWLTGEADSATVADGESADGCDTNRGGEVEQGGNESCEVTSGVSGVDEKGTDDENEEIGAEESVTDGVVGNTSTVGDSEFSMLSDIAIDGG